MLGTQEQGAHHTFRRSNAGQRDKTFQIAGGDSTTRTTPRTNLHRHARACRWSRDSTPIWQKRWTGYYGGELVGSNEDRWNYSRNQRDRGTWLIAAAPVLPRL